MAGIPVVRDFQQFSISTHRATILGMILVEILSNAMKYAFPDKAKGKVTVKLTNNKSRIRLTISDNGIGLPSGFDITNSKTLGLHLVSLMASQLEGTFDLKADKGARFTIEFPE